MEYVEPSDAAFEDDHGYIEYEDQQVSSTVREIVGKGLIARISFQTLVITLCD